MMAKRRAAAHGALLLLASATPSTESYYAAQAGRYTLVEPAERKPCRCRRWAGGHARELAAGNVSSVSRAGDEISRTWARGEQTILL